MEKVKVDKKTYEKLIRLELLYGKDKDSKNKMIKDFVNGSLFENAENLKEISFYDFSEMMILGYELEETKEEKLLRYYNRMPISSEDIYSFRRGILTVLDIYNLKVKGINQ